MYSHIQICSAVGRPHRKRSQRLAVRSWLQQGCRAGGVAQNRATKQSFALRPGPFRLHRIHPCPLNTPPVAPIE